MRKGRLYIGNVPFSIDEQALRDFFAPRQLTDVKIVTDRDTGKARGFAFVELADPGELQSAIADLDGREMGGRTLRINEAQEKPKGNGGSRDRGYSNSRNGDGGGRDDRGGGGRGRRGRDD